MPVPQLFFEHPLGSHQEEVRVMESTVYVESLELYTPDESIHTMNSGRLEKRNPQTSFASFHENKNNEGFVYS